MRLILKIMHYIYLRYIKPFTKRFLLNIIMYIIFINILGLLGLSFNDFKIFGDYAPDYNKPLPNLPEIDDSDTGSIEEENSIFNYPSKIFNMDENTIDKLIDNRLSSSSFIKDYETYFSNPKNSSFDDILTLNKEINKSNTK